MFANLNDFNVFKIICKTLSTYTISSEKTTTVVLKELIRLPVITISENI